MSGERVRQLVFSLTGRTSLRLPRESVGSGELREGCADLGMPSAVEPHIYGPLASSRASSSTRTLMRRALQTNWTSFEHSVGSKMRGCHEHPTPICLWKLASGLIQWARHETSRLVASKVAPLAVGQFRSGGRASFNSASRGVLV